MISITKVYLKKVHPIKKKLANIGKASKWKYIYSIESIMEIGMLTETNSMKALEPIKIFPSKDGGPYSYQTY